MWNIPFYQENHYTCSSYVARVLEEYGVCHWENIFPFVTPKDFMEKFGRKRIFEGSLRELVEMSVQEETVCAVEKLRNSSVQKEERWLRGYEKENLADSLISWDYVFDFLYVTPWTESVRNLSGSKKYVVPYLIALAGLALFFVCAEGKDDLVSAHIHAKKTDSQTTVLCVVGKEKVCSLWRCIQYSFIGFFYSGITPSATGGQIWLCLLLYEQRWKQRF